MNYLSSKIFSALSKPAIIDIRKTTDTLSPSSASIKLVDKFGDTRIVGSCIRSQYYRVKGIRGIQSANPDWEISAMIGDKLHELVVDIITNHGYSMGIQLIRAEHSIYSSVLKLSGRSDMLVWDHSRAAISGIEIKSVGEYKASKVIDAPAEEHVLQAMLYLDYYRRTIPQNMPRPDRWYILYISRTENWTIKGKKHGSSMGMIWDFYITLDDKGIPTIHSSNGIERWEDFSIQKIYDRHKELLDAVAKDEIPNRDFDIKYSEEKIAGLYKRGKIDKKTDTKAIETWLGKGAKPGGLKLEIGDFECKVCEFQDKCWGLGTSAEDPVMYYLPEVDTTSIPRQKLPDQLF